MTKVSENKIRRPSSYDEYFRTPDEESCPSMRPFIESGDDPVVECAQRWQQTQRMGILSLSEARALWSEAPSAPQSAGD